jgi:hypothetical protein
MHIRIKNNISASLYAIRYKTASLFRPYPGWKLFTFRGLQVQTISSESMVPSAFGAEAYSIANFFRSLALRSLNLEGYSESLSLKLKSCCR